MSDDSACDDSSVGSVMVLFIASPHRQPWLTSSSGICSCAASTADASVLVSMSRRSISWRWLRSCLPVDARQCECIDADGSVEWDVLCCIDSARCGCDSSPDRVIARSRLLRPSNCAALALVLGTDGMSDADADGSGSCEAGGPPPSSMSRSAHSHVRRYLASIVLKATTVARWLVSSFEGGRTA